MRADFRSLRTRPYQLLLVMANALDPMSTTSGLRAWSGVPCRWHGFWFAIPQSEIAEITAIPDWMDVPSAPAWVLGVCQWRGQLVPLIDPQSLLHGGRTVLTAHSRVLIFAEKNHTFAFLVDEVASPMTFQSHESRSARDLPNGFAQEWQFCLMGSARRISPLPAEAHALSTLSLWPHVSVKRLAQHPLLQQNFLF